MKNKQIEMAKEIGRDLAEALKEGGKKTAKLAFKASYPILGNLSENVQTNLENLVGREYYDSQKAFETSLKLNPIIYAILSGGITGYNIYQIPVEEFRPSLILQPEAIKSSAVFLSTLVSAGFGGVLGMLERAAREDVARYSDNGTSASLPGRIVSLPFDTYCFCSDIYRDKIKSYFNDVRRRVEDKER